MSATPVLHARTDFHGVRSWLRVPTLLLLVTACGCTHLGGLRGYVKNGFKVGPKYCKPAAPVSDAWMDEYDARVSTELPNYGDWWTVFNDPLLSQLMDDMYQQNLSLRIAGTRVLEARYRRAIAVGSFFPQSQNAFGDFSHQQISRNAPLVPPNTARAFGDQVVGFDTFWEMDVWGRFRRNIEAADANLDSSIEDYDAILVSLFAETATTYVELRTAQQRLEFARSNLKTQEGSLRIATSRAEEGLTSEVDVTQARTQAESTAALIPGFENDVRIANNRLCILLGIPPRDLKERLGSLSIPAAPPNVALGIPANLLRRRPDVRSAERQVAEQSAQIGVAVADLLPHFTIRGTISWQAENFNDIFESASQGGVVAPGFTWDILNYGRLTNNVRVQEARFQQLAVDYQQAVLDAHEEVENATSTLLTSQQQLVRIREAVNASERGVDLALKRYQDGLDNFNVVFNLQTILLAQQDQLATLQGGIATSLIDVYRALGGGWEVRYGNSTGLPDVIIEPLPPVEEAPEPGQDQQNPPVPDERA